MSNNFYLGLFALTDTTHRVSGTMLLVLLLLLFIVSLFRAIISLLLNNETKGSFVDFFLSESENV